LPCTGLSLTTTEAVKTQKAAEIELVVGVLGLRYLAIYLLFGF